MGMYGAVEIPPHVLNRALDGGEWLALAPDRFSPGGKAPCTYW
jgi:hypothetical protein